MALVASRFLALGAGPLDLAPVSPCTSEFPTLQKGVSPLVEGQWVPFLAFYAGLWTLQNFVRPLRCAAAWPWCRGW